MSSSTVPIRDTWAEIDLDNLSHNIQEFKRYLPKETELMAVVKADGYGHGAYEVCCTVLEEGVNWLGVAFLEEGVVLRRQGIKAPILILGYTSPDHLEICFEYELTPTIFTYEAARVCGEIAAKKGCQFKVHIKVDTGMGRIGIKPEESLQLVKYMNNLSSVKIEGIFTHFSAADEEDKSYTWCQFNIFREVIQKIEDSGFKIPYKHACNSAAAIDLPEMHMDIARIGISMYGSYTSFNVSRKVKLKPVMSLKTRVSFVKKVDSNTAISYGRKYITRKESVIATLPIGYGDGYSRLLSNRGSVLYNGSKLPVIGAVCMDQTMVLADNVPWISIGDEVVLIGNQGNKMISADDLAEIIGTISYEIYCMIDKRVPRLYYKKGELVKIKTAHLKTSEKLEKNDIE